MSARDIAFDKGLPANLDAERFVLGSILLEPEAFLTVAAIVEPDDFSLEANRRIFARMAGLHERGEKIDRVTLANDLMKVGQLESVGGLSYLVSLDDGLPQLFNLEGYIKILKENSMKRRLIFSAQKIIDRCFLGADEPEEILADAEETLLKLGESSAKDTLANPGRIIEEFEGGINSFLDPSRRIKGISTGFLKLDEMTSGFHGGELIILAARPAMGKTALALNMAQHVAANRAGAQTVAVFSLEMSKESLLTRMVCASARVDQQKFRMGYLNAEERRRLAVAAQDLIDAPLFIDDSPGITLIDMHAKLRRLKAEHGLGLVVVDYLQLMSSNRRVENRNQEVSQLSRGLKLMSKDLRVPFVVLSQLSRAPETRIGDHRPQLADLRESGSIEQDADLVMFVFREEYYKPDREDLRGLAELLIAKQRNGPVGRVKLAFLREFTKFENLAADLGEEG